MVIKEDLKSNSLTTKKPQKNIEKVVTGAVKIKKKSELKKLTEAFLPEDLNAMREHLLFDVVIPYFKKGILDAVETLLYGSSTKTKKSGLFASKIDYNSIFDSGRKATQIKSGHRSKGIKDLDQLTFERLSDAKIVLGRLDDIISQFGVASVGDLYELADVSTDDYAINNYGWTDLSTADIQFSRDGYYINFPRIELINK